MKGFIFKTGVIMTALLSSLPCTATSKTTLFNSRAGCMACHQSESGPLNETFNKHHEPQAKTNAIKHGIKKGNSLKKI